MARPDADATTVLYLAGVGRSGSTLLERTLARMDGAVAVGEVVHIWERAVVANERCGCGAAFSDCPFWGEVGDRAFGGWDRLDGREIAELAARIDRTRFVPFLVTSTGPADYRRDVARLADLLGKLYPAIRDVAGQRIVVDSSKDPSYAYLLERSPRIDLRVLHAIRDAPAVAYSWAKLVERPDAEGTVMAQWSPRRTSVLWSGLNMVVRGLRPRGVPIALARYEDFVADPAGSLAAALRGVDLPVPPADGPLMTGLRDGVVDLGVDHTVSGNPIRFSTGQMTIREDRAWEERFPVSDRRLVETLTAPVRLRFGYLGR